MNKRKGWELAGYIAGAAVLLVPLLVRFVLLPFALYINPRSDYTLGISADSSWVCETDGFCIYVQETDGRWPCETTLIMENGDAIALTPQNRNIERSIKYYVGNNNWYWSDEAHPMESNAPAVSFMPYYFLNGRYAVCLRVESIYPEIAEKPFLIFKRID